jgi:uncharacterized protein (DUF4415 family)
MEKRSPLTNKTGEVRKLTAADLDKSVPCTGLPESLQAKLTRRVRGPQKTPIKERITIHLSPEVVAPFRATGDSWQTRLDTALKDWLKPHTPT